jgi:hypothetical protein
MSEILGSCDLPALTPGVGGTLNDHCHPQVYNIKLCNIIVLYSLGQNIILIFVGAGGEHSLFVC